MVTPLHKLELLSSLMNIDLRVKRDDLYQISGGGSKGRKLEVIFAKAIKEGHNAVVTTGSSQSNHIRSTALFAARLGWKSIMIVHDVEPPIYHGNLKLTALTGAELRFVDKSDVKGAMDAAMQDLFHQGLKPLYIWGGGHCVEGAYSFYKAVEEVKTQLGSIEPNFIVVASGTGTTQAGIEIGVRCLYPKSRVLGVSVARDAIRGKRAVYESMEELKSYLKLPITIDEEDIFFDDAHLGGGYEAVYPELIDTISWSARSGLILDPTYTAKAFHALKAYVEEKKIPAHSTVVFWHTGGLLNLMAAQII